MSNNSVCNKCSLHIDARVDLFTVCEGDCACHYHANCVGLSENDIIALKANIIWLCDNCMNAFLRARDGRNNEERVESIPHDDMLNSKAGKTSIEEEVRELKHTVTEIMKTMNKFSTFDSTTGPPLIHSTPVASSSLQDGTNMNGTELNNDESVRQQCRNKDRNFALLLTNIDASVDECDVYRMVTQALSFEAHNREYIDVVKLASRWNSHYAPDFISFKVIMDDRWRSKAMDPSTWPKGVKFREFIRKRIVTWKPPYSV